MALNSAASPPPQVSTQSVAKSRRFGHNREFQGWGRAHGKYQAQCATLSTKQFYRSRILRPQFTIYWFWCVSWHLEHLPGLLWGFGGPCTLWAPDFRVSGAQRGAGVAHKKANEVASGILGGVPNMANHRKWTPWVCAVGIPRRARVRTETWVLAGPARTSKGPKVLANGVFWSWGSVWGQPGEPISGNQVTGLGDPPPQKKVTLQRNN